MGLPPSKKIKGITCLLSKITLLIQASCLLGIIQNINLAEIQPGMMIDEIIDDKTIVEHYIKGAVDVDNVKRDDKRVVFVKRGKRYVFYGVFTAEPCKNENKIIYKCFSDIY